MKIPEEQKGEKKPHGIIKVVCVNLLLIMGVLILAELIWGTWLNPNSWKSVCRYVLCDADLDSIHLINGMEARVRYTKDEFGLRGRRKPTGEIDILVVGGSTTDQRLVDDEHTWDHLLEERFLASGDDIDVVNAGIDGQSSRGHIWNFTNWFPLIEGFAPKYVLFYLGINDIPPQESAGTYDNDLRDLSIKRKIKTWIKQRSISFEVYKLIKGMLAAEKMNVGHSEDRRQLTYGEPFRLDKNDWDFYQTTYLKGQLVPRLRRLAALTKKIGAQPIFVTQRTARWLERDGFLFGLKGGNQAPYVYQGKKFTFNYADIGYAERLISEHILMFCQKEGLACLNGYSEIHLDRNNTYDLVHTTANGSQEIAKAVYRFLRKLNIK